MSSEARRPDVGALFVVSGPSGVGKSTLIGGVMRLRSDLSFSVSATTRAPRRGEVDGEHYHFLTPERFEVLAAEDAFLEHAHVYDRRYGTLRAPTDAALQEGRSLLLDIDVQGAEQIRAARPDAVTILVLPPSLDELERRLRARGTEAGEVIERRMAQVAAQTAAIASFDYVVVNDDLAVARRCFEAVFVAELARVRRHPGLVREVRAWLAGRAGKGAFPSAVPERQTRD